MSPKGNFDKKSAMYPKYWKYTPVGLYTTPKFYLNKILLFIAQAPILCRGTEHAVICTYRDGFDHFCEVSLKTDQQFNPWKPNKIFLFISLSAILCSGAELACDMVNLDGTDHFCEVSLKSDQQFDLWKPDNIFLFIALAVILCSQAECVADMHN
jgi:hypothetical protein